MCKAHKKTHHDNSKKLRRILYGLIYCKLCTTEQGIGRWVVGQMSHENRMNHIGHELTHDPSVFLTLGLGLYIVAMIIYRVRSFLGCQTLRDVYTVFQLHQQNAKGTSVHSMRVTLYLHRATTCIQKLLKHLQLFWKATKTTSSNRHSRKP